MPKVLYDISVLGVAQRNMRARTGIFRVVERLAHGLAAAEDCELTFCAGESLHTLHDTRGFLATEVGVPSVPFSCTRRALGSGVIAHALSRVDSELQAKQGVSKAAAVYLKTRKTLLYHLQRQLAGVSAPLIRQRDIDKAEICHTPFYPIAQFRDPHKAKNFVTVYDLIPILLPQFFEFKEDHLLNDVVNGIDPETFVLCISESTKNDLCNHSRRVDAAKVFVTPLAASDLFYPCVDIQLLAATRAKYGIPPESPYLLSLSTFEPRKNIAQTIRCFVRLVEQERLKDLCLVLVGAKGWDYEHIFQEIGNCGAFPKNRIIVTGFVPDGDLAPLYSGAEMFIYPSFYEGFGLPPLEAMQCGIPVITSNTSSLPEVVGDAGIMVSPTDADALSQGMLDILSDRQLRDSLACKSLERAGHFSWDRCVHQTLQAYRMSLSH